MNALQATVSRASELAYEEDADQIVGRIQGEWAIAHCEDEGRIRQMNSPWFVVKSTGLDATDVMASMDMAGIEGEQDWENETTTYLVDGDKLIVNNSCVSFGEEED